MSMKTSHHNAGAAQYEGDIKLFMVLIPCINVINYYLTYSHIDLSWRTLLTFCIDTVQGYAAWLGVRYLILWLDRRMPFTRQPSKRIICQLLLTLVAGVAIIALLTEFVNWLATNKPVPISFYTTDIWIISIWFFVVNGIYIGLYYFNQFQQAEKRRHEEGLLRSEGFTVKTAKRDLLLGFEQIRGFYVDNDYAVLVTAEDKKFFIDQSLDKVEKALPAGYFFRLNRQYLIHRQLITGYEKGENGKLNVLLKSSAQLPIDIPVSRTKAPAFKTWWLPGEPGID
jgi:hypothetical protein